MKGKSIDSIIFLAPRRMMIILGLGLLLSALSGCSLTRHLGPDEYLIKSFPSIKHQQKIDTYDFEEGIDIRPNRRLLGGKFALQVHNFGIFLEKRFQPNQPSIKADDEVSKAMPKTLKWLKYSVGEPPVLLDTFLIKQDLARMTNICYSYGYFHPQLSYEIDTVGLFRKKKVNIAYTIEEGIPFVIRARSIQGVDNTPETREFLAQYRLTSLNQTFKNDTSLLAIGSPYSHTLFEQERARAVRVLQNAGYNTITPGMIRYVIDTNYVAYFPQDTTDQQLPAEKSLSVDIQLLQTPPKDRIEEIRMEILGPYTLQTDSVLIHLQEAMGDSVLNEHFQLDRISFPADNRVDFWIDSSLIHRLDYRFLAQRIYEKKGGNFSLKLNQRTQQSLRELGMFQYILIRYEEIEDFIGPLPRNTRPVRMTIEARVVPQFQVRTGVEVFTTDVVSLLPNAGVTASIRNRNALKKSEQLEATLSASLGLINRANTSSDTSLNKPNTNTLNAPLLYLQLGLDSRMTFKQFLFSKPIMWLMDERVRRNLSRYSPTTIVSASLLYKNYFDDFSQLIPAAKLSYQWQHIPFKAIQTSRLTPLSIGYIDPNLGESNPITIALTDPAVTPSLVQDISRQRLSSALQYSFTHTDRVRRGNFSYTVGFETGGHFIYLMDRLTDTSTTDQTVNFGNVNLFNNLGYGQFVKGKIEGKYGHQLGLDGEIVFHGRIGAASPVGSTRFIPRERRFYAGGVNGLRGWPSNTLGPGRTSLLDFGLNPDSINNYASVIAAGGDFLFEANIEYRKDLISYFELAIFTDVGNVWLSRKSAEAFISDPDSRAKAILPGNWAALGWDLGVGLRVDWDYVIIRLDFGQQIYDPALGWSLRSIDNRLRFVGRPVNVAFGINYPF